MSHHVNLLSVSLESPPADSYFHISKSNSALARGGAASVVAHDTHNFAIMIPRTGGLSRAVIDPKRGDGSDFYVSPSPLRQLLSARHVRIFYRHNEVFQMLS